MNRQEWFESLPIDPLPPLVAGFRDLVLRAELQRLAEKYGTQEVINAALAVKDEWSKRIREAG